MRQRCLAGTPYSFPSECLRFPKNIYPLVADKVGRNLDAKEDTGPKKQVGTRAAFQMFQNKVDRGTTQSVTTLKTKLQNTIT